MATLVKNGVAKIKLANEAVGKKETSIALAPKPVIQREIPVINLDD